MADSKFNSVLQQKVDKKKENAAKDAALRKEYGIEEGRTVGIKVKKDGVIVSLWKILLDIVRIIATIAILILATIGIIAILHPDSRAVLLTIKSETFKQLGQFLPFLSSLSFINIF